MAISQLFFFFYSRMTDNILVCSDVTSVGESDSSKASIEDRYGSITTVSVGTNAKSARDLVKGQEKLLTMLQDLKYELSKMDREASRIREDVARSKHTFSVIFNTPENLYTKPVTENPRSTFAASSWMYKHGESELSLQYLNKICTYTPKRSPSGYRSESHSKNLDSIRQRAARFMHTPSPGTTKSAGNRTHQNYLTHDHYSATESDTESTTSSCYQPHSGMRSLSESTYYGSSESISEDAGSSTESNATIGKHRAKVFGRRTSSFYQQFGESSQ